MQRTIYYQLLYRSRAVNPVDETVLRRIQSSAARNNQRLDITGFLLHVGDTFVQLIEGPERSVLNLLSRLTADPRHTELMILHAAPTASRTAPGWSMGVFSRERETDREQPNQALSKLLDVCLSHSWDDGNVRAAIRQALRSAAA